MVEYESVRHKNESSNIEKFVTRKKRNRWKRAEPPVQSTKTYIQKTLWNSGVQIQPTPIVCNDPKSQPVIPQNRNLHVINLARKRKRQRQLFMDGNVSKKTFVRPLKIHKIQKVSTVIDTRPKKRKWNEKYIPIRRRTTIREKIRKSGRELKNSR